MMIVFGLLMLVCGCAGKSMLAWDGSYKALKDLPGAIQESDRIIATAQIDLTTAQGHYPARAALILQKPAYLRLEILPIIGPPDFFLTANPDKMKIFIPSQGEIYSGKPSAENLAHFLPWALDVEEMVMILSCSYPNLMDRNVLRESSDEGNLLRLDIQSPSGDSMKVWIEKNGRMTKLIRSAPDDREIYQVAYEDYPQGALLAGKITIRMGDHITSVSVRYSNMKIEKATDMSVFELPIPSEIKIIKLD